MRYLSKTTFALAAASIVIAATPASAERHDYSRAGYDYSDRRFDSRSAVERCVRAAERQASRFGRARITDVTRINRVRGGFEVRGRLVVEDRGFRGGRDRDRFGNDFDRRNVNFDKGRFACVTRFDRIADLRFSGLNNFNG